MWSRQRISCGCTQVSVTLSVRGAETQGRGAGEWKGSGVCCPSAVTDLIFDFAHLSTRFTVKFNSRLTAEKRVSLSRSLSLSPSYSLCSELACFGVLLSHIFAHGLTKCAEKRRQHFVYFCTQQQQQQQKPVHRDNIWRSMQTTTTSGLNAHKNTRIYGIYNILYLS